MRDGKWNTWVESKKEKEAGRQGKGLKGSVKIERAWLKCDNESD